MGKAGAENLIKAHKRHLASDRTSCTKATANQFRLMIHTAAYRLMLSLRGLAPKTSFWRETQFDTPEPVEGAPLPDQARRPRHRDGHTHQVALPTAFPYQAGFADLAGHIAKLPP